MQPNESLSENAPQQPAEFRWCGATWTKRDKPWQPPPRTRSPEEEAADFARSVASHLKFEREMMIGEEQDRVIREIKAGNLIAERQNTLWFRFLRFICRGK
jgi:hypothetical protein